MRFLAALCFCLSFCPLSVAQEAELSPRVGAVLDREERAYFGLFPGAEGFESARAEALPGDSVRVTIQRAGRTDSVLVLNARQAKGLAQFVEGFEAKPTVRKNRRYNVSQPFIDPAAPVVYPRSAKRLVVLGEDGAWVGYPYYVTDSLLVMRPYRRSEYDWKDPLADAFLVPVDRVRGVERSGGVVSRSWFPYLGGALLTGLAVSGVRLAGAEGTAVRSVGIGMGIGSVAGLFVAHRAARKPVPYASDDVREGASFARGRVPLGFPDDAEITLADTPATEYRPASRDRFEGRWVRVLVGFDQTSASFRAGSGAVVRRVESTGQVVETPTRFAYPEAASAELVLGARVLRFVEAGLALDVAPPAPLYPLAEAAQDEEVGTVEAGGLSGYGALVLPLPRRVAYGGSVALGGGVEAFEMRLGRERPRFALGAAVERDDYDLAERTTVAFWQASAEVFVAPRTSFLLRYRRYAGIGTMMAPGEVVNDPRPGSPAGVIWREEEHEVTFGSVSEVAWGVRLHL